MPVLKFTMTEDDVTAATGGGGEPAPPGFYSAEITSCEHEAPENKNERIHVQYRIVDADEQYTTLHEYIALTPTAKWKYDQFLLALGVAKGAGGGTWDPAKQKGKKVRIRVINETYSPEGGQERITAKPAGVWSLKGGGKAKATSNGASDRLTEISNMTEEEMEEIEDEIRDLAKGAGVDVDDYSTWAAAVEAMVSNNGEEPDAAEAAAEPDEKWSELLGMDEEELAAAADDLDEYNTFDLDPNDYPTWIEYREAIVEAMGNAEGDDGATEGEDYTQWSIPDLRQECKARDIETGGGKAVLVKRLQEADATTGPFG